MSIYVLPTQKMVPIVKWGFKDSECVAIYQSGNRTEITRPILKKSHDSTIVNLCLGKNDKLTSL